MLWYRGTQNIGLSNHKLKSAITCIVWSQYTAVLDGQTGGRTNIMATNASRAKNLVLEKTKF